MRISHNNKCRHFLLSVILFAATLSCTGCFYSFDPCEDEDNWEEECFYHEEKNEDYGYGTIFGKDKTIIIETCTRYCTEY